MSAGKKIAKRIVIGVALLSAVLLGVVSFALGPVVKKAVEAAGPALGIPLSVQDVRIFPWRGTARIDGLVVGPPPGFEANLIEMTHFRAHVQISSLFGGGTVVIRELVVQEPVVTYELAGIHSNVGLLLEMLGGTGKADDERPATSKPDPKRRNVVIEHFLFEGGKVRLATTLTGGKGVVLPLPTVELRDVGKAKDGISTLEALRETTGVVCVAVLTTVRDGVAGIAGLGADAVGAIAGAAGAGLQSAGALLGSAAGAAGELAGQGVQAVGDLAGAGAKAVGNLATGGAKAVGGALRSVGGLLGGKKGDGAAEPARHPANP